MADHKINEEAYGRNCKRWYISAVIFILRTLNVTMDIKEVHSLTDEALNYYAHSYHSLGPFKISTIFTYKFTQCLYSNRF